MPTAETVALLWRCGLVSLFATLVNGFLLYFVLWGVKFAKASLVRSGLASLACTGVILAGFSVVGVMSVQGCPWAAGLVLIPGIILAMVLTLPVLVWVLRTTWRLGVVVWAVYAVATPLIVGWTVFCLLWAGVV